MPERNTTLVEHFFKLESSLRKRTDLKFENKASIFWGACLLVTQCGAMPWNDMMYLYADFCAKQLGIR